MYKYLNGVRNGFLKKIGFKIDQTMQCSNTVLFLQVTLRLNSVRWHKQQQEKYCQRYSLESKLWTQFSQELFWAPFWFLHISTHGIFSFSIVCNLLFFELLENWGDWLWRLVLTFWCSKICSLATAQRLDSTRWRNQQLEKHSQSYSLNPVFSVTVRGSTYILTY